MIKCQMCRGSGWYQSSPGNRSQCPYCNGRGSINENSPSEQRRARDFESFYGDDLNRAGYSTKEISRILEEKSGQIVQALKTMPVKGPIASSQVGRPPQLRPTRVPYKLDSDEKERLRQLRDPSQQTLPPTQATSTDVKRQQTEVVSSHTTAKATEKRADIMGEDDIRGRRAQDMILAPNEYAYISDETKGEVNVFVGPNKQSLAGTDQMVKFDTKTKRFSPTSREQGNQLFQTAPEGWYVVLKNPAEGDKHPAGSGKLSTPTLRVGKKVNISGPCSFALWPGQMAKVVQGHSLKSNEYLLCRVYDEEAARANWSKAVIKTQGEATTGEGADATPKNQRPAKVVKAGSEI